MRRQTVKATTFSNLFDRRRKLLKISESLSFEGVMHFCYRADDDKPLNKLISVETRRAERNIGLTRVIC